jgi:hypothetical protein
VDGYSHWVKESVIMDTNKEVTAVLDTSSKSTVIYLSYQENYISLPLIDLSLVTASDLLQEIDNQIAGSGRICISVQQWNPVNQIWDYYWFFNPPATAFTLDRNLAYKIVLDGNPTSPLPITISGYLASERTVALKSAWNYVGWISYQTPIWASDFATLVGSDFVKIGYWDGASWIDYRGSSDPDFELVPGGGYRLEVTNNPTFVYWEPKIDP